MYRLRSHTRPFIVAAILIVMLAALGTWAAAASPVADVASRVLQQATATAVPETSPVTDTAPSTVAVATPGGQLATEVSIQLVKVAEGLADPIHVTSANDGSGRLFIVERIGRIRIVQDGALLETPFLDLMEIVKTDFLEQGLLGLAFHPNYEENGFFYVNYTDWRTNGDTFIVRYQVSADDPNVANPDSALVLLTYDQPYINHNGGTLHFGPDGYLYIASGDGGLAGDPYNNAQALDTLLGKILRIDVNVAEGQLYAIPPDNPFVGRVLYSPAASDLAQNGAYLPNARPEIWAYGLRNPWGLTLDPQTGDFYINDVGQNVYEEINFQPASSTGGENYGWDIQEGAHCYPEDANCGSLGVQPVAEYTHAMGGCSITGIGVYRGAESAALDGIYFTSDYCSGKVWGLAQGEAGWVMQEVLDTDLLVAGSGQDEAGELYVTSCPCAYDRSYDPLADPGGMVWRIVASDQVPEGAETAPTTSP